MNFAVTIEHCEIGQLVVKQFVEVFREADDFKFADDDSAFTVTWFNVVNPSCVTMAKWFLDKEPVLAIDIYCTKEKKVSLSACEKCCDSPCTCGWDYRSWPTDAIRKQITMLQSVIADREIRRPVPAPAPRFDTPTNKEVLEDGYPGSDSVG